MLQELKCQNCGAALDDDGHCPYCGSRYKIERVLDYGIRYVPVYQTGVKKLCTFVEIPRYMDGLSEETQGRYVADRMRVGLADALTEFLKITKEYNPVTGCDMIRGEIRVVPPDFRF